MCGIAGCISLHENPFPDLERLKRFSAPMTSRGPDADGYYQFSNSKLSINLAHRRLKIIDLSDISNQPMQDAGEKVL